MSGQFTVLEFQGIFLQLICLMTLLILLSGSVSLWLANQKKLTEQQMVVFEMTTMVFYVAISKFFSLLGMKKYHERYLRSKSTHKSYSKILGLLTDSSEDKSN